MRSIWLFQGMLVCLGLRTQQILSGLVFYKKSSFDIIRLPEIIYYYPSLFGHVDAKTLNLTYIDVLRRHHSEFNGLAGMLRIQS